MNHNVIIKFIPLLRDVNTPQLAAQFLGVALLDTARLAARSFIILAEFGGLDTQKPLLDYLFPAIGQNDWRR